MLSMYPYSVGGMGHGQQLFSQDHMKPMLQPHKARTDLQSTQDPKPYRALERFMV